jgi:hypothetical protein
VRGSGRRKREDESRPLRSRWEWEGEGASGKDTRTRALEMGRGRGRGSWETIGRADLCEVDGAVLVGVREADHLLHLGVAAAPPPTRVSVVHIVQTAMTRVYSTAMSVHHRDFYGR